MHSNKQDALILKRVLCERGWSVSRAFTQTLCLHSWRKLGVRSPRCHCHVIILEQTNVQQVQEPSWKTPHIINATQLCRPSVCGRLQKHLCQSTHHLLLFPLPLLLHLFSQSVQLILPGKKRLRKRRGRKPPTNKYPNKPVIV